MPSQKILVVDDDIEICHSLERILKRAGYKADTAQTGTKASKLLRQNHLDLVLLDMCLPDADGLELAQTFLKEKPQIPIILISAHGTVSRAVEATKMGVYYFLEKPLERDLLLVTVRNALNKRQLEEELIQYKQEMLRKYRMVGQSPAMRRIFALIDRIAPSDVPVLITGENGTGKELVANAIHARSPRAKKPMIKINCPAIPSDILESDLFGHTKGSFTGASDNKKGRLEMADGGTVFLDEIGEIGVRLQVKLLRFLENGEIQKVGSTETLTVDARLIAATNRDLDQAVKEGNFREDLFYRINVVHIRIPPLRERPEDIKPLVEFFAREIADANGFPVPRFTPPAIHYLTYYTWPGNIRQVRNFVERAMIMNYRETFDLEDIRPHLEARVGDELMPSATEQSLQQARREFERKFILETLKRTKWNISQAARSLNIDRANFYRKLKQLEISPENLKQD